MRLSPAAINGKIIEAGGRIFFNARTGDSNLEENGYKSADVIAGGKIVDGIGGGIVRHQQRFTMPLYGQIWILLNDMSIISVPPIHTADLMQLLITQGFGS